MTDPIPTEAVEAAARAYLRGDRMGVGEHSGRHHSGILSALTAAAPIIAVQATADLRAGIEALRDEWRAEAAAAERNGRALDRQHMYDGARAERLYAMTMQRHADSLNALLRGAANV